MLCGHDQARQVFSGQQERIGKLESGLARVEVTVEQLADVVASEHKTNQETRREDRIELKSYMDRMEKSVSSLGDDMKKIAERTSAVDSSVLIKQSQATGAIEAARWIGGALVAILSLVLSYQAGQRGTHYAPEPPMPQYSQKVR